MGVGALGAVSGKEEGALLGEGLEEGEEPQEEVSKEEGGSAGEGLDREQSQWPH